MNCANCRVWLGTCGTAGFPCVYTQARRKAAAKRRNQKKVNKPFHVKQNKGITDGRS
jgi:hypothetical protein